MYFDEYYSVYQSYDLILISLRIKQFILLKKNMKLSSQDK